MLSFLLVLCALIGVEVKAFPSRHKRNYEGSYHYIPYEEGIVRIPAGYSPENLPNYQDYIHGYVQANGPDWSAYYQPILPQPIKHHYSNINQHQKMKAKHTWHFIDQNEAPVTQFTDGMQQFDSDVEAPNLIEALVKKEVSDEHGEYDAPGVVESLTIKEKPVKDVTYIYSKNFDLPVVVDSFSKKDKPTRVETVDDYGSLGLPVANSLTQKDKPIKVETMYSYRDFELPVVMDSLTKKDKPADSHGIYEPIKEKPIKDVTYIYSNDFDLPVVVDSLSKKDKPSKVKPVAYDAFERPFVVDSFSKKDKPAKVETVDAYGSVGLKVADSLTKKDKPIKVETIYSYRDFELPVAVDSLTKKDKPVEIKPAHSHDIYEPIKEKPIKEKPIKEKPIKEKPIKEKPIKEKPIKEKPIKEKPIKEKPIKDVTYIYSNDFNLPVVVDSLSKNDKPSKVEPAAFDAYELPVVVDSFSKKDKHTKVQSVASYETLKLPTVVSLNQKEEPIIVKPVDSHGAFKVPVGVDSLSKKVEPTHSTDFYQPVENNSNKDNPVFYDTLDHPLDLDSLNKVEEHEHEIPVVIEALIRKEKPTLHAEEYELPIVVEALVRRHPPEFENETNLKEDEKTKNLLHPTEESISIENVEKLAIPLVESLNIKQDTESKENAESEGITFDETLGSNQLEIDSFNQNGNSGSGKDLDRSRFARSFFPVNSNVSVVTNIQQGIVPIVPEDTKTKLNKPEEKRKFKNCVTPKNETGKCMPFQQCSVSSTVINIDELLRNVCVDEVFVGVCCPEFPVETVRVDWEQLKPDAEKMNEDNSSQISKECGRLPSMVTGRDPWPWMASLIANSSEKIFCGGALITEQYVLTAAHCTKRIPRNQILVRLGRPDSENRPEPDFEVIEIKRHAGYNPKTMQNDIALLKLSRRVQLGGFRRLVCLTQDVEDIEGLVSESASLLRWKETPGEIKDVEPLTVISNQDCQSRMRTAIADSILCTEPRTDETMCNADSGAPLIMEKDGKFEVIGILTWNRNDCDERFPAVFTRVSSYHRWVEKLAS